MSAAPGSMIAGYQVVSLIGSGGMGEVYLVENPQLGRREAMKVVSVSGGGVEPRVRRALRQRGPHRRIAGPSEHHHDHCVRDRRRPPLVHDDPPVRSGSGEDPAHAALDYTHARGVVHRDIKPGNIVVTRHDDGRLDRAVLLDFGIAKLADFPQLTAVNSVVGTMAFTAPEVIGGRAADGRSDQYSLACTVYKLLTGAFPFPGDTSAAVMTAHLQQPAPSPRSSTGRWGRPPPEPPPRSPRFPAARRPRTQARSRSLVRVPHRDRASRRDRRRPPALRPRSVSPSTASPSTVSPSTAPISRVRTRVPTRASGQVAPGFQAAPFGPASFPPPAKKSRTKWFVLAAVVVLIAAVGGTAPLWWPSSAPPEEPGLA